MALSKQEALRRQAWERAEAEVGGPYVFARAGALLAFFVIWIGALMLLVYLKVPVLDNPLLMFLVALPGVGVWLWLYLKTHKRAGEVITARQNEILANWEKEV